MYIQPWQISSWPIIERDAAEAPTIAAYLRHLGTVVSGECDEFGRLLGHTIWGSGVPEKIGAAWDWTETLDSVFALSDPMSIITNIDFIDSTGSSLSETMLAVQLNKITNALPWQAEVSKATRERRQRSPWSARRTPPIKERFRASELGGFALSR